MRINIDARGTRLRERLSDRLDSAGRLLCPEHHVPVEAVMIHGFENGWFDAMCTTRCERLTRQAAAIVKSRC